MQTETGFDLEAAITQAYEARQAKLRADKERKEQEKQAEIDKRVAKFQEKLDQVMPSEMQQALGVKIARDYSPTAVFTYCETRIQFRDGYSDKGLAWGFTEGESDYVTHVWPDELVNWLLIKLGDIRERYRQVHEPLIIDWGNSKE